MDKLDHWRICDEFSVVQATLLILGCDPELWGPLRPRPKVPENLKRYEPTKVEGGDHGHPSVPASRELNFFEDTRKRNQEIEKWNLSIINNEQPPKGYWATLSALKNAVCSGRIKATVKKLTGDNGIIGSNQEEQYDWHNTTILAEELKKWLTDRGQTDNFFFSEIQNTNNPDYLNPGHECYAPKLAAAVHAWIAVSGDQELQKNKTPKKALVAWLRKNANHYKLTKSGGNLNRLGIEEISKVANWKMAGSPKTPG